MDIRYTNKAIANNFGDYIELNEGLKEYPKLHDAILRHELNHTRTPGFTKTDFMLDMEQPEYSYKDLMKFILNNPASLSQLLPFYKRENIMFYDVNMIIIWAALLGIISFSIYFAFIV